MVTSDGISEKDWDRVHELAVEIVNAGEGEEGDEQTAELLSYLDRLEEKYGVLPSILATRADYVEDSRESLALLRRAYDLARERQDYRNMLYVASSLVSLNIERFRNADEAERWLRAFEEALKYAGGESDIREQEDLAKALEQLRRERAEGAKRT
jgi:hypothetical protein